MHRLSLAVVSQGYSLAVVHGLLIAVASIVEDHQLWGSQTSVVAAPRLSRYPTGLVTPQHVESSQTIDQIRVPYVLAGGFLTTGPSRKSCGYI